MSVVGPAVANATQQGVLDSFVAGDMHALAIHARHESASAHTVIGDGTADRVQRLAVLHAAPDMLDSWMLLPVLASMAGESDRRISATAARAAARIARDFTADTIVSFDIPREPLTSALASWLELWREQARWPDIRVHALEVVVHLQAALRDADSQDVASELVGHALTDTDVELRLAALQLVARLPVTVRDRLLEVVRTDEVPVVAEAARLLCDHDPRQTATQLAPAGTGRLAKLLTDRDIPVLVRASAARCVALSKWRARVPPFVKAVPIRLRPLVRARLKLK